jgi:hypothetical protein
LCCSSQSSLFRILSLEFLQEATSDLEKHRSAIKTELHKNMSQFQVALRKQDDAQVITLMIHIFIKQATKYRSYFIHFDR